VITCTLDLLTVWALARRKLLSEKSWQAKPLRPGAAPFEMYNEAGVVHCFDEVTVPLGHVEIKIVRVTELELRGVGVPSSKPLIVKVRAVVLIDEPDELNSTERTADR